MPRKREGCSQLAFEVPDELLAAMRESAEAAGLKLTQWILTACAKRAGVEYVPPKLGRPPAEPEPPPPLRRGRGKGTTAAPRPGLRPK